jgi:NAD-dependent SIR2 family protein deacetylase
MKYRRQQQRPDGDVELRGFDHSAMELPPCEACGGVLKPGVVLFGENVPAARVQGAARRVSKLCGPFWLRFPYVTLVFSRNIEGGHARAGAMAALARSDALLLLGTSCQVFGAFKLFMTILGSVTEIPLRFDSIHLRFLSSNACCCCSAPRARSSAPSGSCVRRRRQRSLSRS